MTIDKPELPIVDLSPFLSSTSTLADKQQTAKVFYNACVNQGFFYLVGHGIPEDTRQDILQTAKSWFINASDEEKAAVQRKDPGVDDGDGARGYQRIGENVTKGLKDQHEAIDLYREWPDKSQPPYELMHGPNRWPAQKGYKEQFETYLNTVLKLGSILMQCMALSLDLPEDYFESFIDASFWVMRIVGYPPLNNNEEGVSCGEHTDYGVWTFLLTDETRGALKVQSKDGSWISADPVPGAYIVNTGDMAHQWTNGLFKSTVHKVVHTGTNYRVSVPVFFEPNFDAKICPLEGCVKRTGGVAKYGEKVYGEHLLEKVGGNFLKGERY